MTPDTLSESAALLGEPSRLRMLWALLDRRSYTATELALAGEISAASASMHLAKLLEAGWLSVTRQGRHRYYLIADDTVAHAVEAIGAIRPDAAVCRRPRRPQPGASLQHARSCYGHLAGEVAVAFWEALASSANGYGASTRVSLPGARRGSPGFSLGTVIDCSREDPLLQGGLRPCMDWTERTFHLGGRLGVRVLQTLKRRRWVRPMPRSRLIVFSPGRERTLMELCLSRECLMRRALPHSHG